MSSTSKATIHDVAKQAGVSHMTVSRVFSGKGPVAVKTRRLIMKVAESLDYQPNVLASGLRGARTRSVAIVWPYVDPWAGDSGIGLWVMQQIQSRGFATYQAQHWPDVPRMSAVLDDLTSRHIDGLVLFCEPSQLIDPALRSRLDRIPAVVAVVYEPVADFHGDQVIHDRNAAIRQVVDHFANTGRKRIAFMTSLEVAGNLSKWAEFVASCRRNGLPRHEHELLELSLPSVSAERPFASDADRYRHTLDTVFPQGQKVDVDAIFSFNDTGAMVASNWLQQRGLRVPQDVAVAGFNNVDATALWSPPLASGDRRRQEVASTVERFMTERLADPSLPPRQETVSMQFIWRASAG